MGKVQITLAEEDKAEQHNHHRNLCVANAAERSRIDLIEADHYVEGGDHADEIGTELKHVRLGRNQAQKWAFAKNHQNGQSGCDYHGQVQGFLDAFLGTLRLFCTVILSHERGGCHSNALHRNQKERIQLVIAGPAGHTGCIECVDVGLHEHVGKGGNGLLNTGGHTHRP